MVRWSASYLLFLIRVQWVDRRATSSFLIGITIQTVVLSLGLIQLAEYRDAAILQAAIRASVLVGTAICGLGAMSAFQNEFRYQTAWKTARDKSAFAALLAARALAMVAISAPSLAVPFAVAFLVSRGTVPVGLVLVSYLITMFVLVAFTHIMTLLLSLSYDPSRAVPWIRQVIMIVALGTLGFLSPIWLRSMLPFLWIERILDPATWWQATIAAIGITLLWWLTTWFAVKELSWRALQKRLLDNVEVR